MSIALLLLPDFLLIALGALLRRMRGFDRAFWSGVERLVYFVLFPALLFRSLATSPLGARRRGAPGRASGVGFTLGRHGCCRRSRSRCSACRTATFAACFQCGFRFNTYVALAVGEPASAASAGLALISLLVGVLVPLVNVAAVGMLARGHGGAHRRSRSRATRWCSPARPASRGTSPALPLPAMSRSACSSSLATAALPLGLLAVGAGLRLVARRAAAGGGRLVERREAASRCPRSPGARARRRSLAARAPDRGGDGRGADRDVGLHPRDADERRRRAGRAADLSSGTLLAAITLPLWIALVS